MTEPASLRNTAAFARSDTFATVLPGIFEMMGRRPSGSALGPQSMRASIHRGAVRDMLDDMAAEAGKKSK